VRRPFVLNPFSLVFAAGILWITQIAGAQNPRPAEQVYKNIKVLQGTAADSFNQGMHLISGALGVNCEYCHVERDFVSDSVKKKDVARAMITMTAELNQKSFEGKQVITCYTCHQGHAIPVGMPKLPRPNYPEEAKPASGLPSAAEVLAKYITALGGEQNLRKINTRIITAQQDIPTGPGGVLPLVAQVEIHQKAPNLMLRTAKTNQGTSPNGYDGKTAWTQDAKGKVNMPVELEQLRERRAADFFEPLNLTKEYGELKVEGVEKVGSAQAYLVTGTFAPGVPIQLYFDTKSGLLLRRWTVVPTAAGNSPFQVDYADYRDAGHGVKYPYTIHMEPAGPRTELITHSTIHVQKIQENVALEDARFLRPESK
jgi:hypothetical protein